MDCVVTPLKTLMVFSVHLNVQLKFYNLPYSNLIISLNGIFSRHPLILFYKWRSRLFRNKAKIM
ncbi:hypothetical protein DIS15_06930 [Levilactobacillus brevis]|nr:hypothetical protein DIS15_06930 [Levilactobacillus brevis]